MNVDTYILRSTRLFHLELSVMKRKYFRSFYVHFIIKHRLNIHKAFRYIALCSKWYAHMT